MSLFIAIEGGDGSGKGTQATLVAKRLRDAGYDVLQLSFPRYGETSAEIAGKYLDGEYGAANDLHPDLASLPFAIDRFAAKNDILEHLKKDKSVVISDRYVTSNLAHQGTKLSDERARHEFYDRISNLEFGVLGLPRPDISVVLLVPSDVAQANVDKKASRSYTDKKRDIHEEDAEHLDKTRQNYIELTSLYPQEFTVVECMQDDHSMRTIEDINDDIWQKIMELEK